MSIAPYKTLMKRASDSFIVNKSRFIGHGAPVESEEEALGFLAEMRREYQDASHNCYAYIIGTNMGIMRYNDDGEPGGTAGMPIIEVMKARGVTTPSWWSRAISAASYWARAVWCAPYTQGAAMALNAAQVAVMHPTQRLLVDVPYPLLGRFEHFLKSAPVRVEDKAFTTHHLHPVRALGGRRSVPARLGAAHRRPVRAAGDGGIPRSLAGRRNRVLVNCVHAAGDD